MIGPEQPPSPTPTTPDPSPSQSPPYRLGRRRLLGVAAGTAAIGLVGGTAAAAWRFDTRPRVGATVEAPTDETTLAAWKSDIDTLADHGLSLVRTAAHPWRVAPAMGRWDAEVANFYREALAYAKQRRLAICLVVPGAPDWAQDYPLTEYVEACRWFWAMLADTYDDQAKLWQVFNEADATHYRRFTPIDLTGSYLDELAGLLQEAQGVLGRAGTPITTNVSGWPMDDDREATWRTFLDTVAPALDLISVDVYPADNESQIDLLPARIDRLRQRYGKRVFVAEVGLQTAGAWSEDDQRRYLPAAIQQLRSTQLWGLCLYQLRDQPDPAGFGIEHADGTPKASFADVMTALA